ncbi:MAG: hypothetical protein BWX80_02358 [Candidatus Hydrogenedentes bacterium ADurb.Bin101]|nr:MAG: hypothetical protein BWX80_02358 [Candidatus Hydrogenedentes bacterium ADurb.Bin101]
MVQLVSSRESGQSMMMVCKSTSRPSHTRAKFIFAMSESQPLSKWTASGRRFMISLA